MFRSLTRNPGIRLAFIRRSYATDSTRVPLNYDLHKADQKKDESPIIFMHGLFGSKKNNRTISERLAADLGRDVYALDLRNHGESPHHPRHDYLAMADDVLGFMDDKDFNYPTKPPTLIGHSMGAKVAMVLALRNPSRVKDIISVDNAPVDATLRSSFSKYILGMKKIDSSQITTQKAADAILKECEPSLPIRQFLLGNLHRPVKGSQVMKFRVPLDVLGTALGNMGDFPFKNPEEARFTKEVLVVRGGDSHYVPDEVLPVIGQFFPRFRLATIEGAGHWVISEKPVEFKEACVEFLTPSS